ncbi:MAG: hypothetical protein ABMA64_43040, partial [Myxococcota bacterium]
MNAAKLSPGHHTFVCTYCHKCAGNADRNTEVSIRSRLRVIQGEDRDGGSQGKEIIDIGSAGIVSSAVIKPRTHGHAGAIKRHGAAELVGGGRSGIVQRGHGDG